MGRTKGSCMEALLSSVCPGLVGWPCDVMFTIAGARAGADARCRWRVLALAVALAGARAGANAVANAVAGGRWRLRALALAGPRAGEPSR